jgi:hypothetical protein
VKRIGLALFLALCCFTSFAQTSGAPGTQKQAQQESGFMSWVHDAWKTVQEQGRPAAERLVRQWPKRFQSVKQQVADLSKTVRDKVVAMDLEQKRNLVVELWRVRKSLDLMTLLQPELLHSLTGLDTSALASLETQVQRMTSVVQAQINAHR